MLNRTHSTRSIDFEQFWIDLARIDGSFILWLKHGSGLAAWLATLFGRFSSPAKLRDFRVTSARVIWIMLRKAQLHQLFEHAQIKGVGGPGAPHLFLFERAEDVRISLLEDWMSYVVCFFDCGNWHLKAKIHNSLPRIHRIWV